MRLTTHFDLEEFTFSETAIRMGRAITPTDDQVEELRRLCNTVLEPLREELGPLIISSGYRPTWLNQEIGGAVTSDHILARAADCRVLRRTPLEVCKTVVRLNLPVKQVILEYNRWAHVSIGAIGDPPKRQQLTARMVNGQVHYFHGLEELPA